MRTNMHELMNGGQAAQYDPVTHMNMTGKLYRIGNHRMAANLAIMSNMHIRHDPVIVAQSRRTDVLNGADIDCHVLTKRISIADHESSWFAAILFVLRMPAYRTKTVEIVISSNAGMAVNHTVRTDNAAFINADIGSDDA